MSDMVFDLDDLCDDFNPWSELHALKERFPGLKVTLFAIPGRCSDELLARYRDLDWVELGVHGYHHSTMECAAWTYDETVEKLREIAEFWSGSKLFKAPGWIANQAVYDALFDEGWMVADNAFHCENFGEQPIKRYVYNIPFDGISIHGHTWDCMGNGPSDWDALFDGVPSNATFRFVSEVCEPLSWVDKINKSYLT
jgi:calcineurin-like phosphoesterase family protein